MKKDDFKLVKSVATIANLVLAMFISEVAILFVLIIKLNTQTISLSICFGILYLICAFFGIYSAKKLSRINFEGTSKEIAKKVFRNSKLIFFPLLFAIDMNRIRGAMWEWYISQKTSHIEDPIEKIKIDRLILDEIYDDGFISKHVYEERINKYPHQLKNAIDFKKEIEKEKKEKPKTKKKGESWI